MTSIALDTISATESISDGHTIISAGGSFELGFFSLGNSKYYLGIWFKKISHGTVAWVANRETPLTNSSGVLKFDDSGKLVLLNHDNLILWSSNISREVQNPVAQLLDSGNLVIRDENDINSENHLWQSFHHPDQTFLPGMKIGRLADGLEVQLSSWKSADDPSQGDLTFSSIPVGYRLSSHGIQV
ncbi:hypothetical protein RCOM_1228510 [Ricinus communis]|uniref:Bulb-type lectin domain-containing protein n=1 Tax=Ricinus communis TaxID=3988 RepID=B9SSB4_RICCO|nr:hypothetical protein RCOM_1228510 [Ricinus communis]